MSSDNTLDLTDLVQARINGRPIDDQSVTRVLTTEIASFPQPTGDHAVWWNGRTWSQADAWSAETRRRVNALNDSLDDQSRDDGWRLISRADVFNRAGDPLDLFLAAMAWGFGNRGYGWRRTSDIVNGAGEEKVALAVESLRRASADEGSADTWRAWSRGGDAKLRGLDTAFASKVAYFACFDLARRHGPLIADLNTAWALWALAGKWDSRKSAALYADYVDWAERWAEVLNRGPDDVERALFNIGPETRRTWKRLHAA